MLAIGHRSPIYMGFLVYYLQKIKKQEIKKLKKVKKVLTVK